MGLAFYVVVESEEPGFDTTVDGKALSKYCNQIDIIAGHLGLKSLEAYCSIDPEEARSEMLGIMGFDDESELPPESQEVLAKMPPAHWYDAADGLDYAQKVGDYIRANPDAVKDAKAVLYDLDIMTTGHGSFVRPSAQTALAG